MTLHNETPARSERDRGQVQSGDGTRHKSPAAGAQALPLFRDAASRRQITFLRALIDGTERQFRGRNAWALGELVAAGERGVTPIDQPGPRWSQYVHILRREGVNIETRDEKHGGAFPGSHGRYFLISNVEVLEAREGAR